MTPYFIFLAVLIALTLCEPYLKDKNIRSIFYLTLVCCLILFAGFRRDNPDWYEYSWILHEISVGSDSFHDEGFNVLAKISLFISHEPVLFFLLVATLSVCFNAAAFRRYTPYLFSALLIYFCHNYALKEMIQIRAGLASAICLYSLYYLVNGKQKIFFCLFLAAMAFHVTAVIFFLAYLAWRFLSKKQLLYCVILSLLIGTFMPLGAILKKVVGIGGRLDDYIAYGDVGYAMSLGIWGNMNTLKCLAVFCFLYFNYKKLNRNNRYFEAVFKSYVMGLCWLICFNDFAIIGARMSNILISGEPVLLSIPYCLFKQSSRFFYSLALILLALMMFYTNIEPNKIVPYVFYF